MKRKRAAVYILLGIILIILSFKLIQFMKQNPTKPILEVPSQISRRKLLEDQSIPEASLSGKVINISYNARTLTVLTKEKQNVLLLLTPSTKVVNQNEIKESLKTIQKGFEIEATGKRGSDDSFTTANIKITSSPAIIVYSPKENQQISKTFDVNGVARVFENNFFIRLTNKRTNTQYLKTTTATNASGPSKYGDFNLRFEITNSEVQEGDPLLLELFQASAKDGSEIDKVSLPLTFKK
jgi:hypothetical protein